MQFEPALHILADRDLRVPRSDLHMTVQGDAVSVRAGLGRLMGSAPLMRLSADCRGTVEIVMAEVLNNIVEHAYRAGPGPIRIAVQSNAARLTVYVCDQGQEMPQGEVPQGLLAPLGAQENLPEGGFGWHLIRELTDELLYERRGLFNHLRFSISAEFEDEGPIVSHFE